MLALSKTSCTLCASNTLSFLTLRPTDKQNICTHRHTYTHKYTHAHTSRWRPQWQKKSSERYDESTFFRAKGILVVALKSMRKWGCNLVCVQKWCTIPLASEIMLQSMVASLPKRCTQQRCLDDRSIAATFTQRQRVHTNIEFETVNKFCFAY